MQANAGFGINVDFTNFFRDHRSNVRIFLNDEILTIEALEDKIKFMFGIENFYLTARDGHYLPPSEDVRLLVNDETIQVVPSEPPCSHCGNPKKGRKSKRSRTRDCIEEVDVDKMEVNGPSEPPKQKKKKRKKSDELTITLPTVSSGLDDITIKKSKKDQCADVEEYEKDKTISEGKKKMRKVKPPAHQSKSDSDVDMTSPLMFCNTPEPSKNTPKVPNSNCINGISTKETEYVCKGDLASYTKAKPLPTITDQYLKQKKVNIVKIDYVHDEKKVDPKEAVSKSWKHLLDAKKGSLSVSRLDDITKCLIEKVEVAIEKPQAETNGSGGDKGTSKKPRLFFFRSNSLSPSSINQPCVNGQDSPKEKRKNVFQLPSLISPVASEADTPTLVESDNPKTGGPSKVNTTPQSFPSSESKTITLSDDREDTILEDSCDMSYAGSNATSTVDKSPLEISGLYLFGSGTCDYSKKPQLSGVGSILGELRANINETIESKPTEHVTKRKRIRTRRRRKQNDTSLDSSASVTSEYTPRPMNVKGCPSVHVKFEYDQEDEDSIKVVEISKEEEVVPGDHIIIDSDLDQSNVAERDILKAPSMKDLVPKEGDVIAFKILRIGEDYSPGMSSFITGRVAGVDNGEVLFDIISGLDQCQEPKGKLSVDVSEGDAALPDVRQKFAWGGLLNPRLLYP